MMHDWPGWGHGMGWGGFVLMLFFWAFVIFGVVFLLRSFFGRERGGGGAAGDTALEVLKKRYARGEISREEYEQKKRDLE